MLAVPTTPGRPSQTFVVSMRRLSLLEVYRSRHRPVQACVRGAAIEKMQSHGLAPHFLALEKCFMTLHCTRWPTYIDYATSTDVRRRDVRLLASPGQRGAEPNILNF